MHKWFVEDAPLNGYFVRKDIQRQQMSAMRMSTKKIQCTSYSFATITMQYEIYNNAH